MNNIKITSNKQVLSNNTHVATFFPEICPALSVPEIVDTLMHQIEENPAFVLGSYSSIDRLKADLAYSIFGDSENISLPDISDFKDSILETIRTTISRCVEYAPIDGDVTIFVLPMKNEIMSADLDGVNAFALGKNTVYILINPTIPNWQKSLLYTLPHEYAHLVSARYVPFQSIRTGIVYEGLAEHFREFLFGGDPAKYSLALTREDALKAIPLLSDEDLDCFIDDSNYDFYLSYFFGTGNFPDWYGYSLGYWLIDSILKNTGIPLSDLFKLQSKEVFGLFKQI